MAGTVRFGVVGIHGFSRAHLDSLMTLQDAGAAVKLVAAVAHAREQDEAYAAGLETRGVRLVNTLADLLAMPGELDCITLPTGIPLHVPMGTEILQAGFPLYLEKPVAGAIQDVDRLLAVEQETGQPVYVGYQDGYQPSTWQLKQALLEQQWGALRRITVMASWPRHSGYYARNNWAGKLALGESIVLDSPLNNACAHYMNLPLFLAGSAPECSAAPTRVEAELYRVNPIESFDTVSLRVHTEGGVEIVYAVSHAGETGTGPHIRLECDNGVIVWNNTETQSAWVASGTDGTGSLIPRTQEAPLGIVAKHLAGKPGGRAYTLSMARPHTLVVNGAHLASAIHSIPDEYCYQETQPEGGVVFHGVRGMADALDACFTNNCLLSECGVAPWAQAPGTAEVAGLRDFVLP